MAKEEKKRKLKIETKHLIIIIVLLIIFILILAYAGINNGKKAELEEEEKVVRKPVFAGSWYPGNKNQLDTTIEAYFENVEEQEIDGTVRAMLVPHAGYVYSGQVAAYGFKHLNGQYDTVILLGPSHRYALSGASVLNVTHYATPLGEVKLSEKVKNLLKEEVIQTLPQAHKEEHSLEIELPFLQKVLGKFELIPILVGPVDIDKFTQTLLKYYDDKTLIVVSADLSHYHPYDKAVELDTYCLDTITNQDIEGLTKCEIDAPWAIASLLHISQQKNWKPKVLLYKNSGDVTGDKSTGVVGYASVVFYEPELSSEEKEFLLELARTTIETYLSTGKKPSFDEKELTPNLKKVQGCFVTLNKNHNLRGCIGHILPQEELYKCVIDNAVNAAVHDSRFKPVTYDELEDIEIDISVLTVPQELKYDSPEDLLDKLRPNIDGVVLKKDWRQSTYLPQVWEQLPGKELFLSSLCKKAGLPNNCWQDPSLQVQTYQALVFAEE
ncbi:hypothetical protein AYK26_07460 [Euryarchaeota archaeon SM23-78]|nr:MAG: hypothetical protein AYK26_07460 [Euryarchaeota archaeon SM23-78]MBW3001263.1 AmmeMemoRadiSam system protein B [Candidatus Woesearchaeota archaeon]